MFSKLSKFRSSKSSSRNGSRQDSLQAGDRTHSHSHTSSVDPNKSPAMSTFRMSFSQPAPGPAQSSAPPLVHLVRNASSLSVSQNTIPIPSVVPLAEDYDSESDGNVSFAECLFPITPPGEVRLGRRFSHESFMEEDFDDFDQLVLPPSARSLEPHFVLPLRKQGEMGRMSVDLGRRCADIAAPPRRSVDVKKMNWWDVNSGFSDTALGLWENRKELIESRRATWEASYRQVWVQTDGPNTGTGTGSGIGAGSGGGGKSGLTTRTTTRSWTSSSLPDAADATDASKDVLLAPDEAEEEFLEEFEEYFNNLQVDNVRRKQYPKLELQKIVYLDYASFSLFSNFQVEEHLKILLAQGPCLGAASFGSSSDNPLMKHVTDTQRRLLRLLNTTSSHYSVVFTSGFQESFRLVAEAYPFHKGCPLLVCQDNHAAVRLVIQAAVRAGAKAFVSPVTEKELCFHSHDLHKLLRMQSHRSVSSSSSRAGVGGLFMYPVQSQLSGMKHSMGWVVEAQQHGWKVCLDASTLLPSNALDLDIHQPDFVVGSFHHMLGYPSGMGFLLVRRESFCVIASPSNDTVRFIRNKPADEGEHCHILCPADHTMNLLQFAALSLGLLQLERIGFSAIQKRVRALSLWLVWRLRTLRHKDGAPRPPLLRVYGSPAPKDRGSIVAFNVMDPSGTVLPPDIVLKLAARSNIHLSAGQFQNPGLAHLLGGKPKLRASDVSVFNADSQEFTVVRASFGAVSNFADVYRLVQFLSQFRDEEYLASEAFGFVEERNQML